MVLNSMLYNRKPQTGTTGFSGVALVHPIETLKYSVLVLRGNANACIGNRDKGTARFLS